MDQPTETPDVDIAETPSDTPSEDQVVETQDPKPAEEPEEKKFTQKELEAQLAKRLARQQRQFERQIQELKQQQPAPKKDENLTIEDFDDVESYAQYLADKKAEKLVNETKEKEKYSRLHESFEDRQDAFREEHPDYDKVVYESNFQLTEVTAMAIKASEIGPQLAYYLASNPKEANRLLELSPSEQLVSLGKIEAKLENNPPQKVVSKATAPVTPVKAASGGVPVYDTSNPESTKSLTTSEWIALQNKKVAEQLKAQGYT